MRLQAEWRTKEGSIKGVFKQWCGGFSERRVCLQLPFPIGTVIGAQYYHFCVFLSLNLLSEDKLLVPLSNPSIFSFFNPTPPMW